MRTSIFIYGVGLTVLLALPACSPSSEPPESPYSGDYTQIQNLIIDLQTAWSLRDRDTYANLLAEDFVFVFEPEDAEGIPKGSWGWDSEVQAMGEIFGSARVSALRVHLQTGPPEEGAIAIVHEEGATRVIVTDTFLDVDIDQGDTTLRVDGDIQWFFFRMGDETVGEDSSRWYLWEWHDLGEFNVLPVETTTVSSIKAEFGRALQSRPG